MDISNIVLNGSKCDIYIKYGKEEVKRTLSLSNPLVEKYLMIYLNKLQNEYDSAYKDMESDYINLKIFNTALIYTCALIFTFMLIMIKGSSIPIILLKVIGIILVFICAYRFNSNIKYTKNPKKEEKLNEIIIKIDNCQDMRTIYINRLNNLKQTSSDNDN